MQLAEGERLLLHGTCVYIETKPTNSSASLDIMAEAKIKRRKEKSLRSAALTGTRTRVQRVALIDF